MAVTLTKDLTPICAGFGDMKVIYTKGTDDLARDISVVYGFTYTASFYNNVAMIDLHGKGLTLVDDEDISSFQTDTSLTIYINELLVGAFGNVDVSKSYYPLNMSQQIGQDNNFSVDKIALCKQIRTNFRKIKRYAGYERRVAFLCIPTCYVGNIQANIKIDGVNKGYVTHFSGRDPLLLLDASNANSSIEIENNSIADTLQVEVSEVPEHPFYVRWINALAGWDYWMFDCRYVKKRKISSRKTIEQYIPDMSVASGNRQTIGLEVEEEVTVGASQLTEEEYDNISALLYSTFVQWYDESRGKWIDVLPSGETSFLKGSPRTDIEITFTLPERQLQLM